MRDCEKCTLKVNCCSTCARDMNTCNILHACEEDCAGYISKSHSYLKYLMPITNTIENICKRMKWVCSIRPDIEAVEINVPVADIDIADYIFKGNKFDGT